MRISDWSSDVCSSDLPERHRTTPLWVPAFAGTHASQAKMIAPRPRALLQVHEHPAVDEQRGAGNIGGHVGGEEDDRPDQILGLAEPAEGGARFLLHCNHTTRAERAAVAHRTEEHTAE